MSISLFDTTRIHVELEDKIVEVKGKKIKVTDTTKTVTVNVAPKSYEQLCAQVQKIYTSQIGVYEKTGKNDGVQIKKYLASVGLPEGYAYCAAGVHWSLMMGGVPNKINAAAASTFDKNKLVWYKGKSYKTPHSADVVAFWIPSLNGIHHCGFYDKDHGNGMYESVEFNTSVGGGGLVQREGGGVGRKVRSKNGTYAIMRHIKEQ